MKVLPAIDILNGRCVRLKQGDFTAVTQYSDDPVSIAARYASAGATNLHIVDLDGARAGKPVNTELLARIVDATGMAVQWGGGLRDTAAVAAVFAAGAWRAVCGTWVIEDVAAQVSLPQEFGTDRLVLAADVCISGGHPVLKVRGWQAAATMPFWDLIGTLAAAGWRHVLCTDIGRDGMMEGPNHDLYRTLTERFPGIEWQASGGITTVADLAVLRATGASYAVVGKALLEGTLPLHDALTEPNAC